MQSNKFVFKEPLDSDGTNIKTVFLWDGQDIYWIDEDGDLMFYDIETPPEYPHEVRQVNNMNYPINSYEPAKIQELFNTSPIINFSWEEFLNEKEDEDEGMEEKYTFNTEAEADAFMLGLEAVYNEGVENIEKKQTAGGWEVSYTYNENC